MFHICYTLYCVTKDAEWFGIIATLYFYVLLLVCNLTEEIPSDIFTVIVYLVYSIKSIFVTQYLHVQVYEVFRNCILFIIFVFVTHYYSFLFYKHMLRCLGSCIRHVVRSWPWLPGQILFLDVKTSYIFIPGKVSEIDTVSKQNFYFIVYMLYIEWEIVFYNLNLICLWIFMVELKNVFIDVSVKSKRNPSFVDEFWT